MADEFKRLDRELVYKGSIIDFYKDTVQVPNGNIVKWDFIKHQGAAAVVPVTADGKLLMVRQYRNALDRYTLEIPAGGLNGPEEPTMEAAARELEEETGCHAGKMEWLITIRTTVAFCNFIPASNEPSSHACMAIWRLPRGSKTPLLCSRVFDLWPGRSMNRQG